MNLRTSAPFDPNILSEEEFVAAETEDPPQIPNYDRTSPSRLMTLMAMSDILPVQAKVCLSFLLQRTDEIQNDHI
jgi:hypothetical protein